MSSLSTASSHDTVGVPGPLRRPTMSVMSPVGTFLKLYLCKLSSSNEDNSVSDIVGSLEFPPIASL